jgi:hypothetical protein
MAGWNSASRGMMRCCARVDPANAVSNSPAVNSRRLVALAAHMPIISGYHVTLEKHSSRYFLRCVSVRSIDQSSGEVLQMSALVISELARSRHQTHYPNRSVRRRREEGIESPIAIAVFKLTTSAGNSRPCLETRLCFKGHKTPWVFPAV